MRASVEESVHRRHLREWRTSLHERARAVVEHALERRHPRARGAVAQRVRARGVRCRHPADRAERAARWIHGEAQPFLSRALVHRAAQRARSHLHAPPLGVDGADGVEAAHVDNHAGAHRAPSHAAPRAARNQRVPGGRRPAHEHADVLRIHRHGHRGRHHARDPCSLGVHGTRGRIIAEYATKSVRLHAGHIASSLGR